MSKALKSYGSAANSFTDSFDIELSVIDVTAWQLVMCEILKKLK